MVKDAQHCYDYVFRLHYRYCLQVLGATYTNGYGMVFGAESEDSFNSPVILI